MMLRSYLCELVGRSSERRVGRVTMDFEVRIAQTDAKRQTGLGSEPAAAGVIEPEKQSNQHHSKDEKKEEEVASLHPPVWVPFAGRTGRSRKRGMELSAEGRASFSNLTEEMASLRLCVPALRILSPHETLVNSPRSDTFSLHPLFTMFHAHPAA